MTAAPFTPEQAAKLAAFDAAPELDESAPMTRAMLALAEELDGKAERYDRPASRYYDQGQAAGLRTSAARIRTTVAAVLAADPEPRERERRCECPELNPDCEHPTCPRYPQPGHLAAEQRTQEQAPRLAALRVAGRIVSLWRDGISYHVADVDLARLRAIAAQIIATAGEAR